MQLSILVGRFQWLCTELSSHVSKLIDNGSQDSYLMRVRTLTHTHTPTHTHTTDTYLLSYSFSPTNPGIVPKVFAMPNIIPAYFGAMSRLLTTATGALNPEHPRDKDKNAIAYLVLFL